MLSSRGCQPCVDVDEVGRAGGGGDGHRARYVGALPDDEHLAIGFRWKLDLLRSAAAAVRAGRSSIVNSDGDEIPAAEALAGNAQFCVVEFVAALLPGWIERGRVWPTELAESASPMGIPRCRATGRCWAVYRRVPWAELGIRLHDIGELLDRWLRRRLGCAHDTGLIVPQSRTAHGRRRPVGRPFLRRQSRPEDR